MESGSAGGGGLEGEFEDSLGDFDETVMGGTSGGGGGSEEEIDILSPTGEGSSGPPTSEPLFEEGDLGGEGDMAENQSVAQRAEAGSSEGASEGGEQGGGGSEGGGQESQGGASSSSGGASGGGAGATQANRKISTSSAGGAEEGGEEIIAIPQDIGDGRNDDIVLRQIREAAMNESDPVLREKLWDEYRRIRGSR
jgi:hypothetical protein